MKGKENGIRFLSAKNGMESNVKWNLCVIVIHFAKRFSSYLRSLQGLNNRYM